MRSRSKRHLPRLNRIAALLLLPCFAGCLLENAKSEAVTEPEPEVVRTPTQLVDDIRVAQQEAKQTAQLYDSTGGAFRRDLLRLHIDNGSSAADELLARADIDEQQAQDARLAKVELLALGVRCGWTGHRDRLATLLEDLESEHPHSAEAALADAALLENRYIRNGVDLDEAIQALTAHSETFADHSTGSTLFEQLARQLLSEQRTSDAVKCCQAAMSKFGESSQTASFRQILRQTARSSQSQQRRNSAFAKIKTKLGGHEDGYFIIFVHKPVITEGSPVDYHVSAGLRNAVAYVGSLNKSMVWELSGWFPRTPDGRRKARALSNRLIEKYTTPMPPPVTR